MPKMNEKGLRQLLKEYENKDVDQDFIYDSFDMIKSGLPELEGVLKDIFVMGNGKRHELGSYDLETSNVIIYLDEILNSADVPDFFKPVLTLETIRHEVEHSRNYSTYLSYLNGKHNIEACILANCFEVNEKTGKVYSNDSVFGTDHARYICSPDERISDIRAWEFLLKLMRYENIEDVMSQMIRFSLFNANLRGYKDNGYYLDPPTYNYLLKKQMYIDFFTLKQYADGNKISLDKRLLLGLPIRYGEVFEKASKCRVKVPEL